MKRTKSGFTIVELLIVIVVIGILASIVIVSYTGIRQKAIISSLQSDLSSALTQIKLYQVINDAYPTNLDCSGGNNPAPPKICLKSSPGNAYSSYLADNTTPQTFCLTIDNSGIDYYITQGTSPTVGSCAALASGNALAADLLSGKTATTDAGSIIGTMTSKVGSGVTITPGTVAQAIPQGYYGGTLADGKVTGDANLIASNIISGKSIFGLAGTASNGVGMKNFASGTVGPSYSSQSITGLSFTPTYVIAYAATSDPRGTVLTDYWWLCEYFNGHSSAGPSLPEIISVNPGGFVIMDYNMTMNWVAVGD